MPPASPSMTPVEPPPPGQTSNFVNPPSLAPAVIATDVTFTTLAGIFALLRLGAILKYKKPFWWDDGKTWLELD